MSSVTFSELCKIFNKISSEKREAEKISILKSFITKSCPESLKSFYPVLRLFLPKFDKERGAYGLKQKKLVEIISNILNLPKNSVDYKTLSNYSTVTARNLKDFTDIACSVLRKRFFTSKNLKISEINESLDNIAKYHNSIRDKEQAIFQLLSKTNHEEHKWILKILLKDLKLGIGGEKILNTYHVDAVKLFHYRGSLLKICEVLHSPEIRSHHIAVELFSPFSPMLSEKCDIKIINSVVDNKNEFFVEQKFDGERFQLHMNHGKFKYFSRKGYDYTDTFGNTYNEGLYTPQLRNVFKSSVKNIILDGEMMGYNKEKEKFGSKGMHFDVKNLTVNSIHQPCLVVFDIILLNDEVLTDKPLSDRLKILNSTITSKTGVLILSVVNKFKEKQDLLDCLNKTIDDEDEGVVFKDPNSLYIPHSRKEGWWKLKLEYFENVMSDMDVIIMGGYYGEGRNRNKISGFLVGVADKYESDSTPSSYLSFAKIQSGLSDDELDFINGKIGQYWTRSGNPTSCGLKWGKEKPHVWIPPENSTLLVVRGSELTKVTNGDYKTPYTIRFPRIQRINDDKPYFDCFSMEDLLKLTTSAKSIVKLSGRYLTLNDLQVVKKARRSRVSILPIQYNNVEQKNNIFEGLEFCVWSGTENYKKPDLEKIIAENGGNISQIERNQTNFILMGEYNSRILQYDGPKDVVKLAWLFRILEQEEFELCNKNEIIYANPQTKLRIMSEYDKFGDSYIKFATEKSLKEVIKKMSDDCIIPSLIEIQDLKKEMSSYNC